MLYRITLHLARSQPFPDGSNRHGYEIVAPLDAEGHLDPIEWKSRRRSCRVRRFWAGEPAKHGLLIHRPGGVGGATWLIDYDDSRDIDDEAVARDAHGGRMFDMLAERGFLTPLDDERREELALAYAARQEEFGSTLPAAQRLEEAQGLYELDRDAILAVYPELTVNGDGWREHAAK